MIKAELGSAGVGVAVFLNFASDLSGGEGLQAHQLQQFAPLLARFVDSVAAPDTVVTDMEDLCKTLPGHCRTPFFLSLFTSVRGAILANPDPRFRVLAVGSLVAFMAHATVAEVCTCYIVCPFDAGGIKKATFIIIFIIIIY